MAVSFMGDHASLMRFMVRDEEKQQQQLIEQRAAEEDATRNHRCIMPISQEAANRLRFVIECAKKTFHIGFLPLLIYLGWTHGPDKGNPPFSITNFLWFY